MRRTKHTLVSAAFLLVSLHAVRAEADLITFNNDALGFKSNGFQSVDSSLVTFSTTSPQLNVARAFECAGSPCLIAVGAFQTSLFLDFAVAVNFFSLTYGNDLNINGVPLTAELRLFRAGVQVGQVSQFSNGNDRVDQVIAFSMPDVTFDRAAFRYVQGTAPVIDNITFTTSIPEPTSFLHVISGLAASIGPAIGRGRRRRSITLGQP